MDKKKVAPRSATKDVNPQQPRKEFYWNVSRPR
jgi:hypothetical protein